MWKPSNDWQPAIPKQSLNKIATIESRMNNIATEAVNETFVDDKIETVTTF